MDRESQATHSDKHNADHELADSQQRVAKLEMQVRRLRALSELAADMAYFIRVDPDGTAEHTWATGDVSQMTGLTPQELADQNGLEKLVHPDDIPIASRHFETLPTEQPKTAEFRIITKGGQARWIRDSRCLLPSETRDQAETIVGAVQDITERVCREEMLQTSEGKYRLVVEKARIAILVIQDGRLVFANPKALRLAGYGQAELSSRPFAEFIHPQDREQVVEYYQKSLKGEPPAQIPSFRIIDRDENVLWIEISPVLIKWDDELAVLATLSDIGKRKWAETILKERTEVLSLLNRIGQQLTATLDLKQIAEQLRQVAKEIIGAESASVWLWEQEKEGWLVCWTPFFHPQTGSPVNLRLRPGQGIAGWAAQTGESVIAPSTPDDPRFYRGIDQQIDYRTHSLIAVPLRVRGSIIGVMEVVNKLDGEFDENDLMLIETLAASAAIAINNAQLIDELHHRTLDLQAHNEDLDTFADTVAHDLKNLLTRVIFHSSILESDLPRLPTDLRTHLNTIRDYAYKMGNIIDALLLLATVREFDELEMGPLDTDAIMTEVQIDLEDMTREYGAEIILPDSWPVAVGYHPWVERVWVNYISNAIRYGGQPPRVELGATVSEDKDIVRFWVRDNGPGLSAEDQTRLFTPFTQLHQVRKGHGLGLSIVRRIVEKLGGRVGVESEYVSGQGSTFFFTLPSVLSQEYAPVPSISFEG